MNCARGGLIDEAALYDAIRAGHVAGAALDVYATEPARESPLFELDEVVVTPHLGAATAEAQEKVAVQPEHLQSYLYLGNLYAETGRADDARTVWERGLRSFPKDATLLERATRGDRSRPFRHADHWKRWLLATADWP